MSVRLGGIIKQLGDTDIYRLVKGKDVDITEGNAMSDDLADADLFLIDDGAAGTQASTKKSTISRVWTYILSKLSAVTDVSSYSWVLDEDDMSSNSNTKVPTQQSVKAYVDGSSSGLSDVVSDTTPQLGGDLDVNGNDIVSASNGDIDIKPNGSGKVVIDSASSSSGVKVSDGHVEIFSGTGSAGKIDFYCESSAAHKVTVQSPAHSAFSGDVQFTLPASNGSDGQVLKTDGSGNLSYVNQITDTNTTYAPGDGLDIAGTTFAVDLKANGGLVIESTEVAVDLGASSITGTLANSDTTATNANTASAIVARDGSGNFAAGTITAGLTGNASTATALETARNIGGVSFNGTSDINLPGVNAEGNQNTSGTATTATTVTITDTAAAAGTNYITFVDALSGNESVEVESALTYAANTNTISANISGDVSGSSGSCTGNAATATKLATARAINGVNFDGTAPVTVPAAGSTLTDTVPVSKGGTGRTTLDSGLFLLGNGTSAVTSSANLRSAQGAVHVLGTASTDPGQIRIYEASDNGSAFTTIKVPADNSNTNPVITLPVATGTMALTSDIPVHTAGDGLTLTGVDFDVDAAQTTITSVLNANLKVGTASDQEYIDFGAASNVIRMAVNNSVVLDVTSAGVEVSGNVDVGGNNVSVNGNVGDTSNNDFVSFGTDGEVSLVTNNSARLTASDTGVFIEKNLFNKTASANFTAQGDIVKIGTGSTTQGELCYYKSDGAWAAADADAVATSGGCLLAIALGTDPDVDGMLLRGMFTLDHDPGTIADELYVSTTAGNITGTAPSGNSDVVRIVGYCLDSTNGQIWFNPSNDFIEITA